MLLNQDKENFQKEQNNLLKTILNQRFFEPWSYDYGDKYSLKNDAHLEIYITNICNQHCSYCYLVQYPDLYPVNGDNKELILHNLRLLYDWICDNNYHIEKCEFFTGEIWHTQFGWEVLDITLEYLRKGMPIDWFMTATNFSFIETDKALQKMNYYLSQFKECGHNLILSCSCDGAIIEQYSRPTNNGYIRDEKYWDRMFEFCKVHNFYFHPMVSATNVKDWIENYKWWEENCKKWGLSAHSFLTMLEVRNDDWTDESIQDYCNFLNFLLEDRMKKADNDVAILSYRLFGIRPEVDTTHDEFKNECGYIPFGLPESDNFQGCTLCTDLTIRLGDLAICPCHRSAYNQYLYGKFVVQDDKIVDIEAINPQVAIKVLMSNLHVCYNACDTCIFNKCCIHGCIGSQIEYTGDPFFVVPGVCKFLKAKYSFLMKKYKELGIIDYLRTVTPYEQDYERAINILDIYDKWEASNK